MKAAEASSDGRSQAAFEADTGGRFLARDLLRLRRRDCRRRVILWLRSGERVELDPGEVRRTVQKGVLEIAVCGVIHSIPFAALLAIELPPRHQERQFHRD